MRTAVFHYGITRRAYITGPSIQEKILNPAQHLGDLEVFAHLYPIERIESGRSGERIDVNPLDYKRLHIDHLKLGNPDDYKVMKIAEMALSYGDHYRDGGHTTTNLVRQLSSLQSAFSLAIDGEYDHYVFTRPDLLYLDSFGDMLSPLPGKRQRMYLPRWQHWRGGYNDRFAVCGDRSAAEIYANRIDLIEDFCRHYGPLHSERLCRFAVDRGLARRDIGFVPHRAIRVRANGDLVSENFVHYRIWPVCQIYQALAERLFHSRKSA